MWFTSENDNRDQCPVTGTAYVTIDRKPNYNQKPLLIYFNLILENSKTTQCDMQLQHRIPNL